jgi:hypothetical protein
MCTVALLLKEKKEWYDNIIIMQYFPKFFAIPGFISFHKPYGAVFRVNAYCHKEMKLMC